MFHQENKILLTAGSSKSKSVSVIKPTGITSTIIFLQGLFLQYSPIYKVVNTIVSLQPSIPVSLHYNIICHFYKGIYMVVFLLSPQLASLRT